MKRIHAWGAIGYNFKSELKFYDIPSNSNGKMTQKDYIEQILEPVVKPWIDAESERGELIGAGGGLQPGETSRSK